MTEINNLNHKIWRRERRIKRLEKEKSNFWVMLPFITDDIYNDWKDTDMIELIHGKPMWTRKAQDFTCLLSPKRELSELLGK